MEPRFNLLTNEIGAKFSKRFANVGLVVADSTLPKSTQELVSLRASRDRAAAVSAPTCTPRRPRPPAKPRSGCRLGRHLARVHGVHRGRAGRARACPPRRGPGSPTPTTACA